MYSCTGQSVPETEHEITYLKINGAAEKKTFQSISGHTDKKIDKDC
jgi:hypothetical protein